MEYFEKQLSRQEIYDGVIVKVHLDQAELVNGRVVKREVVEHPGGVCVLPVDENGLCYMVRQFRYPFGKMVLEAPAGKLEKGEDHLLCGKRELSEETGLEADEFIDLGATFLSPGYSSEILHIYLALGLHQGHSHPDEGEFLNVEKIPLSELYDMAMKNEIEDAKTVIAILKTERILSARNYSKRK
jgi:ADP-ribose pyrophosphatase